MEKQIIKDEKNVVQKEGLGKYILKIFIYLLFGLSGVVLFVVASIWIKFRTKTNKKGKFVALFIGLLLSFVIPYGVEMYTEMNYPEIKVVKDVLSKQFPNGSVSFGVNLSKSWRSGQKPVFFKVLAVKFKSRKILSGGEMIKMGKSICSTLGSNSKDFNIIAIRSDKSFIYPFSIPFVSFYFNASGTCNRWNDPQFAQKINSLSRFFK